MLAIATRAGEFASRFLTLRVRVVAAFVVLISVTLAIAGTQIYVSTKGKLIEEIDLDLQLAASQAVLHLEEEDGHYVFQGSGGEGLSSEGSSDLSLSVLSPQNERWDHSGMDLAISLPLSSETFSAEVGDQDWRALAQPILGNGGQVEGWVQAVRSLRPVDDALAALATELYIILPLAVVLAAVASYFVAGRALRPLTRMAHTAHEIGPATLDRRIRYRGPADEVGQTAMAFDGMLDRVERGFQRERRFSADASHELRTPLAGIKTAIAVTLGRGRSAQEHEEVLHDVDRRVDQLIRLCDDLLLLARGGRPRSEEAETVDLTALLEVSVEELQPSAEEAGVSIQAHLPPRLTVPGCADDLIRLFLNLLSNAIRHTPSGGSVTLTARLEAGEITVLLSDDGPGIAPEHLEHLFEPFYQADPSRSGGDRGVGLGLAIAQEIAHAHGGDIEVHSRLGRGTTFEVRLPGAGAIS